MLTVGAGIVVVIAVLGYMFTAIARSPNRGDRHGLRALVYALSHPRVRGRTFHSDDEGTLGGAAVRIELDSLDPVTHRLACWVRLQVDPRLIAGWSDGDQLTLALQNRIFTTGAGPRGIARWTAREVREAARTGTDIVGRVELATQNTAPCYPSDDYCAVFAAELWAPVSRDLKGAAYGTPTVEVVCGPPLRYWRVAYKEDRTPPGTWISIDDDERRVVETPRIEIWLRRGLSEALALRVLCSLPVILAILMALDLALNGRANTGVMGEGLFTDAAAVFLAIVALRSTLPPPTSSFGLTTADVRLLTASMCMMVTLGAVFAERTQASWGSENEEDDITATLSTGLGLSPKAAVKTTALPAATATGAVATLQGNESADYGLIVSPTIGPAETPVARPSSRMADTPSAPVRYD